MSQQQPHKEQKGGQMPGPGDFVPETQRDAKHDGIGLQHEMTTQPISQMHANEQSGSQFPELTEYKAAGKLKGRKALITGGDSGIGRAVAIFYAKEGADVAINYHPSEEKDAQDTKKMVEKSGKQCLLIPADLQGGEKVCKEIVDKCVKGIGGLDILVSNAAYQMVQESLEEITEEQVEKTFRVNVFPAIYLTKAAMPQLHKGSSVIMTTSIVAYEGSGKLIDYASTKSALVGLIRSLSIMLAPKGIRVNGIAPGPVWTPLQPVSRTAEDMKEFTKKEITLGRIAQPSEIAPPYVWLASDEASQFTGQVLHPNGGTVVNA